jgi:hypothetical protein
MNGWATMMSIPFFLVVAALTTALERGGGLCPDSSIDYLLLRWRPLFLQSVFAPAGRRGRHRASINQTIARYLNGAPGLV